VSAQMPPSKLPWLPVTAQLVRFTVAALMPAASWVPKLPVMTLPVRFAWVALRGCVLLPLNAW
jgi:hypothetical protein